MIKIYNQNRLLVAQTTTYTNPVLEIDAAAFDMLSLFVPADTPVAEEDYIEIREGRFVVKEKNFADDQFELICLADVDDLEMSVLPNFAHITVTMQEMLNSFLAGTGWTGTCNSTMKRTVTGTSLTPLQAILKATDTFGFEVHFDTIQKTITVAERLGQDLGAYFDDELNLDILEYQSDSYEFATRIVPTGFGGLGIEEINNGLPYLENKDYYSKTKTVFWSDERYTVVENLKYDAQKKLDSLAIPLRSYTAKLIDLVKERPELEANVFDTITLKHRSSQTRIKQRVVKKKIPLDRAWDVDVTIANKMRDLLTEEDKALDNVRRSYESVSARLELFQDAIEGEVNSIRVEVDEHGSTLENHSSQLMLIDDQISLKVSSEVTEQLSDPDIQEQFKGDDGVGIASIITEYAKGDSEDTPPETGWSTEIPVIYKYTRYLPVINTDTLAFPTDTTITTDTVMTYPLKMHNGDADTVSKTFGQLAVGDLYFTSSSSRGTYNAGGSTSVYIKRDYDTAPKRSVKTLSKAQVKAAVIKTSYVDVVFGAVSEYPLGLLGDYWYVRGDSPVLGILWERRIVTYTDEQTYITPPRLIADAKDLRDSVSRFEAGIEVLSDEISQTIKKTEYQTTIDGIQQEIGNVQSKIDHSIDEWGVSFTETTINPLVDADADAQSRLSTIENYVRITADGQLIIGSSDNPLTLTLEQDRISFSQGGQELAYFSDSQLTVKDGNFNNSLNIGNFSFTPRSNGNLSLV